MKKTLKRTKAIAYHTVKIIAHPLIALSIITVISFSIFISSPYLVNALNQTPTAPDTITVVSSGTRSLPGPVSTVAQAGNVSKLLISQTRSTLTWQGYVGNVTGSIVLDDALNNTLFNWQLLSPSGEIYAANSSSITWTDIKCFNFTSNRADGWTMNETSVERTFNITASDRDGLGETFNTTFTDPAGFYVGGVQINNEDGCSKLHTFVNESFQTLTFSEVLLTDNQSLVFTSLLEGDEDGYQSGSDPWDFQMMVLENGHAGYEETTTSYWFFLEIE